MALQRASSNELNLYDFLSLDTHIRRWCMGYPLANRPVWFDYIDKYVTLPADFTQEDFKIQLNYILYQTCTISYASHLIETKCQQRLPNVSNDPFYFIELTEDIHPQIAINQLPLHNQKYRIEFITYPSILYVYHTDGHKLYDTKLTLGPNEHGEVKVYALTRFLTNDGKICYTKKKKWYDYRRREKHLVSQKEALSKHKLLLSFWVLQGNDFKLKTQL